MGTGKKTRELEAARLQGTEGKNPTTDALQRATAASRSGCMWALPSAPRSLLPAIFLYGYIKLAETHSTVLRGATTMTRPMETIVLTHRPIWGDIIQLLVSLLSPEDRHRILNEARKWFRETAPEGPANIQRWENQQPPVRGLGGAVTQRKGGTANPQWWENQPPPVRGPGGAVTQRKGGTANPQWWENQLPPVRGPTGAVTQRKGGAAWRDIGRLFYKASRGGPKPMSTAKPPEVIQRESESPSEF